MAWGMQHLLESPDAFTGYFIVGKEEEKIGVVKELLAKRSPVFQAMLFDSEIKEEADVKIPDVHPDAVKIFIKFAYGALEIPSMWSEFTGWSSETAVEVVNFAEKYEVPKLQKIALAQLKPTSVDDLFPALYCVAMYGATCIADDVLKIVQQNTKNILDHPNFLEINQESLLYILKQESLSVPEVELWKAALAWARDKQKGADEDIEKLKNTMGKLLPHIRLLTLPFEDIYDYVEPSGLFSSAEIVELSKAKTRKCININLCSNNLSKRTGIPSTINFLGHEASTSDARFSSYTVQTPKYGYLW